MPPVIRVVDTSYAFIIICVILVPCPNAFFFNVLPTKSHTSSLSFIKKNMWHVISYCLFHTSALHNNQEYTVINYSVKILCKTGLQL